jgi:hypothetical protein
MISKNNPMERERLAKLEEKLKIIKNLQRIKEEQRKEQILLGEIIGEKEERIWEDERGREVEKEREELDERKRKQEMLREQREEEKLKERREKKKLREKREEKILLEERRREKEEKIEEERREEGVERERKELDERYRKRDILRGQREKEEVKERERIREKEELERKRELKERIFSDVRHSLPIAAVLILLVIFSVLVFKIVTIGLAPRLPELITIRESYDYIDGVNLTLNESGEYTWLIGNYGSLKSVRLDGALSKEGSAKVYLEYDGREYLIFDSSRLKKSDIINYASLEDESGEIIDVVREGESINNNSLDKKIKIITTQSGERAFVGDVFEFNVDGEFSWDIDYSKLCTKWDVNLEPVACYGNEECCNEFVGLEDSGEWNDSFYLSYGRYGSGLENVVSARIVYYDVNLSVPYSDIVLSDVLSLRADFEEVIRFEDVCVETCLLDGFRMKVQR